MAEVDGITLMMAIQAVEQKILMLMAQLEQDNSAQAWKKEALLLSYEKTAQRLKQAYQTELNMASNFPPYEKLVSEEWRHAFLQ